MTPSPDQVSKLELWASETAAVLAPELDEMGRFRVMLGLLQARALECRHISGMLHLSAHPIMAQLAMQLGDRSEKLEGYGMEIAKRKSNSSTGIEESIQ